MFLLLSVNDRRLMGTRGLNHGVANAILGLVVAVTVMLGVSNVAKALAATLGLQPPGEQRLLLWSIGLTVAGAFPVWRFARRLRV